MKYILFACVCCVAVFATGACSDDGKDDTPLPLTESNLLGTWELIKDYDALEKTWDEEWGDAYGDYYRLEFRAGGQMIQRIKAVENPKWSQSEGTYSLEGDKLSLSDPSLADMGMLTVRIEKLTRAELILANDYTAEDGRHYTDKQVFRRIG